MSDTPVIQKPRFDYKNLSQQDIEAIENSQGFIDLLMSLKYNFFGGNDIIIRVLYEGDLLTVEGVQKAANPLSETPIDDPDYFG